MHRFWKYCNRLLVVIILKNSEGTGEGAALHPLMPYPSMIQRKSEGG